MSSILISVIIPIYNTSEYLDKCIQSILNQTFKYIEIILIDDGSTDNSLEICMNYKEKYENIAIYSGENLGQGAARNFGIGIAKGKYIGFVDSDDYIDKNMYKHMLQLAESNDADIVCCKYETVCDRQCINTSLKINESYKVETEKESILKCFLLNEISASPCDKIFKKDLLLNQNIYFPENTYYEDIYMILICLYHSNKVIINKTGFYKYFKRTNSTTLISDVSHLEDLYRQVTKCYEFIYKNYNSKNIETELRNIKFLHTNMLLKIIKDLNKENETKYFFEKLPKKLVIFGASSAAELMKYFCDTFNVNILYFCDNNEAKWGSELGGITIISPNELVNLKDNQYGIYIASMYYIEIYNQLSELGLKNKIVDLEII